MLLLFPSGYMPEKKSWVILILISTVPPIFPNPKPTTVGTGLVDELDEHIWIAPVG